MNEYAQIEELSPGEYRALLDDEVNACRKGEDEQEARRIDRLGYEVKLDNGRH